MTVAWETCDLCALVAPATQITVQLVAWRNPAEHDGRPYDAITRCRDAQACRDRYETATRRWPLDDRTVPTLPVPVKVVGHSPSELPSKVAR